MSKTLHNTDQDAAKKNVSDLVIFGGDLFKLLSKASSQNEGWMKSTKAMEIPKVGCVVQVTTQQINETDKFKEPSLEDREDSVKTGIPFDTNQRLKQSVIAEAVTFVPGVKIKETLDEKGIATSRELVAI